MTRPVHFWMHIRHVSTFRPNPLSPSSHLSGPGSLRGLHLNQAAQLQAAPLLAVLHVHLQHQALLDAQEHLPPPPAAAPLLPQTDAVILLSVR